MSHALKCKTIQKVLGKAVPGQLESRREALDEFLYL